MHETQIASEILSERQQERSCEQIFPALLPKVDLHCHLDGSVRPETLLDLGIKHGFDLPTKDINEFRKYVQVSANCNSLKEFLEKFNFFYGFLKFPDAVERIAYELCEDAARENIKYLEVRFAPALQATDKFNMEEIVKSALSGLKSGSKDFKIHAEAILCCYRMITDEENWKTVELAEKYYTQGVVGIDLAGDEENYPTEKFIKFLKKAHQASIPITCHIGETPKGSGMKYVFDIPAQRIGHGVYLESSSENLVKKVKEMQLPIETFLTSNVQTRVVENYHVHPFKKFYDMGLKVTLNTDDRGVSNIDLTHEYKTAIEEYQLKIDDLIKLIYNSIDSAFLPKQEKQKLRQAIQRELQNFVGVDQGGIKR
ncbi:MAG: adenosine deaminase [Elusimicrobiota bacterium]|nr:adenosine deaminase [Elusimicrobiota bacterium]